MSNNNKDNKWQKVEQAKGRPLLQWVGKQPLESVQYYPAQEKEVYGDKKATDFNKLFWGDNLQVLSHLLKEHRGKVDLIYIDPPFDSAADYVKKVKLRDNASKKISGKEQGVLEEMQYTDIWANDEYLQFMYERLLILKEMLTENGSIYVHCDYHKVAHLKLIMDEIFGESNFVSEVIWKRADSHNDASYLSVVDDRLLFYSKSKQFTFNKIYNPLSEKVISDWYNNEDENGRKYKLQDATAPGGRGPVYNWKGVTRAWRYTKENMELLDKEGRLYHTKSGYPKKIVYLDESKGVPLNTIWTDLRALNRTADERTEYPTQKPEHLLERVIAMSSNEGDLVLDCFSGSGTTLSVAQRLGRRWIGCDINIGAIQTTTKRINQIIEKQKKEKDADFKGSLGFKVLNVNEYDVFKNELEAKEIVMEMYGVEPIKRSYFDGVLDTDFVKIISLNRVLNKMDIRSILKGTEDALDQFTKKTTSKHGEAVYRESVVIICSGMELDAHDYLKKENKTGVDVKVYDILNDTKELIFKQYPESKMKVSTKGKKLTVEIQEFYSPLLMRRLEMENEKMLKKERQAKVKDFKQTIDSVAIDVDYDGKLFNAEVIDLPDKKEVIAGTYEWEYAKKGKNIVAVKIIDVLGEEYFETFEVEVK